MTYAVLFSKPSLTKLQRCFFPDTISEEFCGRYAVISLSNGFSYFVRVYIDPLLQNNVCMIDRSVRCSPFSGIEAENPTISSEGINVITDIRYIKTIHVTLIFKCVLDVQNYAQRNEDVKHILKQVLGIFVHTNKSKISLAQLDDINTISLDSVIVESIGNIAAGKVVDSTKIVIDKVLSFERYSQIEECTEIPRIDGLDFSYRALQDIFIPLQSSKSRDLLVNISSSLKILIIGPDGSGKKTLVKRLAFDEKATVICVDGPELCRPLPGESESFLKENFQKATLLSKEGSCILLFLRLESVFGKQSRILSEFLFLLDSIRPTSSLTIIATTSSPHLLHESIRSSSRFQNRVFVGIPSEDERLEMLFSLCNEKLSKIDLCEIVKRTPGFVAGDLSLLVSRARWKVQNQSTDDTIKSENKLLMALIECAYKTEASSIRGELGVVKSSSKLDMNELGGLQSVKKSLIQSIQWPLEYPEAFVRLNIKRPSGVLLYGPPGCAKTSLARALATSSNVTFLSVSAADLYSPYVGDAEIAVTNLFQRARDASPTILFIDEIDALVGNRDEKHRGSHERILSTFLIEMDGIGYKAESQTKGRQSDILVTIIGASNRPDSVDPALLRPGRLDRLIYVPPPGQGDRLDILHVITKKVPLSDCVDLNFISEETELFSGADLNSLCQEASLQGLMQEGMDADIIKHEHWLRALKEVPPSLTKDQIGWYENFSFSCSLPTPS